MSEWNLIHEYFHTKHSVFTVPDAYITQLYIMNIQPVNKAAGHLINSTLVWGGGGEKKKSSQCLSYKEQ